MTTAKRERTKRQWYAMGWNYSARGTGDLEHGDERGYPSAWYDGYMDHACDRAKWHGATERGY